MLILNEEDALELGYSDKGEEIYDVENDTLLYTVVEAEEWSGGGKFQHRRVIFQFKDKFYALEANRSGSYFTEWHTEFDFQCKEVQRKEKVVTEVYYE